MSLDGTTREIATERILSAYTRSFKHCESDLLEAHDAINTHVRIIPEFSHAHIIQAWVNLFFFP